MPLQVLRAQKRPRAAAASIPALRGVHRVSSASVRRPSARVQKPAAWQTENGSGKRILHSETRFPASIRLAARGGDVLVLKAVRRGQRQQTATEEPPPLAKGPGGSLEGHGYEVPGKEREKLFRDEGVYTEASRSLREEDENDDDAIGLS